MTTEILEQIKTNKKIILLNEDEGWYEEDEEGWEDGGEEWGDEEGEEAEGKTFPPGKRGERPTEVFPDEDEFPPAEEPDLDDFFDDEEKWLDSEI